MRGQVVDNHTGAASWACLFCPKATHDSASHADHERQPVCEVRIMEEKGGPHALHTPGTPLPPLKESAPAPSHDLTPPDSPSTSMQEHTTLQFEVRYINAFLHANTELVVVTRICDAAECS